MKISRAIKLGHKNISAHRVRSLFIVLPMSVVFGLLIGVCVLIQGYGDLINKQIEQDGDNNLFFISDYGLDWTNDAFLDEKGDPLDDDKWDDAPEDKRLDDDIKQYYSKYKTLQINEHSDAYTRRYTHDNIDVLSQSVLKKYIRADPNSAPEGTIPVVVSIDYAEGILNPENLHLGYASGREEFVNGNMEVAYKKVIGKVFSSAIEQEYLKDIVGDTEDPEEEDNGLEDIKYYVCGVMPVAGFIHIVDYNEDSASAPLSGMYTFSPEGSAKQMFAIKTSNTDSLLKNYSFVKSGEKAIVSFSDYDEAADFYLETSDARKYDIRTIFPSTICTKGELKANYEALKWLSIILAIAGVAINIFTLIQVILSERSTIALYRSLGASGIDIFMIYFFYLLELCIISVILATAIGFVGALIISNNHEKYILDSLELGFGYRIPERPMIGLNWRYFAIVGIMLLIAPICTLLSSPAFSAKNTAKKMKE